VRAARLTKVVPEYATAPVTESPLTDAADISRGSGTVCARRANGAVVCVLPQARWR
jgi:hypothetical protein